MRKLLQLTAAALLLITVACKKEGVNPSNNFSNTDVMGKWELKNVYSEDGQQITTSGSTEVKADYEVSAKNIQYYITFADDNTFSSIGDFTMVLSVTSFGNTVDSELDVPGWGREGNWNVSEDKIHVEASGKTTEFEIIEVKDNTLKAMEKIDETSTVVNSSVKTTATVYYTFEKI